MKYIDQENGLLELCKKFAGLDWIAVDTEADSLHHYIEKLCLLQVSDSSEDYILDPLALNIKPFLAILETKLLLLHGADFDIRILRKNSHFSPSVIFDTMLAAQLLGYPKQGLADLALRHCEVSLSKTSQTADWSRRPLDEKLLAYASNDTHYLKVIKDKMTEELVAAGRLDWHRETCARLLKSLKASEDEKKEKDRPWQIKGSKELVPRALTILKEIWLWREDEARKLDRPPFKVLNNETMISLADWAVKNPGLSVTEMKSAPKPVRDYHSVILNSLIQKGQSLPEERFFIDRSKKKPPAWDEKDLNAFNSIKAFVEKTAVELKITASLLATNATMRSLVHLKPKTLQDIEKSELLMSWQTGLLGEAILAIFNN